MAKRAIGSNFLVCFLCLILSDSVWAIGFPKMPQYPIGSSFPITGDFNADGLLDLVAISQCSPQPCSTSTITVTLANGIGRFQRPISTATVGLQAESLVTGDFNGDRKLDIAFVTFSSFSPILTEVAVALGNGDGTFGAADIVPTPPLRGTLLVGDVNGDAKSDLLVFLADQWQLEVFLGNGDGTFRALPTAPGAYAECFLVDINHDRRLDLVGRTIQLGNGDGTFQEPRQIAGSGCPVVADFNGDGNLDLAEQSRNGESPSYYSPNGVNLYFGNGDGTFQTPVFRWIGSSEQLGFAFLSSADFNGDGKMDLVAVRGRELVILLNQGSGRFRPPVGYLEVGWPVLVDLNRDNRSDLVFVRATNVANQLVVVPAIAAPDGTFSLPHSYYFPDGGGVASVVVGDLNGDNNPDLAEVNLQGSGWRAGYLNCLLGNGDGTFKVLPHIVTGGIDSYFGTLSDLNRDGKLDMLVVSGDSVNVRLGFGDGKFQSPLNYPIETAWVVAGVADFNGDGVPDVAVNQRVLGTGIILFGNGDGTFRNGPSLPAGFDALVVGDFNGDGKQDLAAAVPSSVGIMLGNGDGTFQPIARLRTGQNRLLLAADFNADGRVDLAGVGATSAGDTVVSIYLGNGDGTLQPAQNSWVRGGVYPGGMVAADFNRDGKVDLAVSLSSNEVAVLRGDGTGRFPMSTFHFGGAGQLVAGDFDGNGTADLAVITSATTLAVLLNE